MAEPMTGVLRPDIELISGETPLLFDPVADAYYKVSAENLRIVSFLTEPMPLARFLEALKRQGITASPLQLQQLIAFLQQNNLLVPVYGEISFKRKKQTEIREKTLFLRFSAAYLFFRLPPWRPEKVFAKIAPYVSFLASRKMLIAFAVPALIGYLLLLRNFNAVQQTFWNSLSWAGLVKYFAAILFLKVVHESAHSLAAMHFGCRIRGIGLGFMVFYPRLYTDTTDSWRLPRRQRLLIDGAGIIAELLCGGIAALLWCHLPPGPWQSTMFYVFAVSTISTLLVNGNPCIRYDGYYLLCDLVGIENLMSRSGECFRRFWRWSCLRLGSCPSDEKRWFLLAFGILSAIYRIFLYTSIILVIYHKFTKTLAVVMMFLELYSILIYPCWHEWQTVRRISRNSAGKARRFFVGAGGLLLIAILCFPLSWDIVLPGESDRERRIQITLSEGGYLAAPMPATAWRVAAGEELFSLYSPHLNFAAAQMLRNVEYDGVLLRLQQLDEKLFAASRVTARKRQSDLLALEELKRRFAALRVTAPAGGVFVPAWTQFSADAYLPRGYKAGEILSGAVIVAAYADDYHVGSLRCGDPAEIRIPGELQTLSAEICDVSPVAVPIRDSGLLQIYGGPISVIPDTYGSKEYRSEQLLYRVTFRLPEETKLDPGRTVSVRVRHREQLYKKLLQFLLGAFRKEF